MGYHSRLMAAQSLSCLLALKRTQAKPIKGFLLKLKTARPKPALKQIAAPEKD